ncbi:MFS sugar transporter [Blastomyces gilchristii SLH14081]|uniref:MFS sugar transporter n=1 Tax=Blastomyces gilchristii (strain SLH14081) TaxID=559298 RepID=A0A179UXV2_BLAGS|nr:MFS sugar transporter [Blastomyces gilchristii SLH14081]OAT11958.1 MFS sugar transporter [Blastomyces gilchristii SLH14081]
MEFFGALFPRIYMDSSFKGWFVSTLLLAAWLGSLANGPFADYIGRRLSIIVAVIVFLVGSIIQAGAVNLEMLYIGRAVAGFSVGQLTMVVPLYISEVSLPAIRGGLVVLQQLSITIGILLSYWIDYGSNYIGGTRSMIYYSPTIFGQLDLEGNRTSLLATGVYGIANCLSTLPALFWIDKVSLRVLLMYGATGTDISLVIVGAIICRHGPSLVEHAAAGWAGIAFIYIYDVNFSYSFAPIGWVLPSEIFNLSIRSKAISITTSTTCMCNFIIGLTLEDMDLVFGDTAAHEEQQRIVQIEAALRGTPLPGAAALKESLFNEEKNTLLCKGDDIIDGILQEGR